MKKLIKRFLESKTWHEYCENIMKMYANGLAQ